MARTSTKSRTRRTDEQLIADLQSKIAQVKRRAEQRQAKRDPALRHIAAALRSIGKAEKESKDPATRQALDEAGATLSACLSLSRAVPQADNGVLVPQPRRSVRAVETNELLAHVRKNPGQRGEHIAAAFGTSTTAMRPVMRELIAAKRVRTEGERRGMSYHPV